MSKKITFIFIDYIYTSFVAFYLKKSEKRLEKIICYIATQVKIPVYEIQKNNFEFYFKPEMHHLNF